MKLFEVTKEEYGKNRFYVYLGKEEDVMKMHEHFEKKANKIHFFPEQNSLNSKALLFDESTNEFWLLPTAEKDKVFSASDEYSEIEFTFL